MFIKEINKNEIKVAIPLTKGTEKARVKKDLFLMNMEYLYQQK